LYRFIWLENSASFWSAPEAESSVLNEVFSTMVKLKICSISQRLAEKSNLFLTTATDTAIQIHVFTALSEVP